MAPCEIIRYGKPEKNTFEFAKRRLRKQAAEQGVEISNFYMIGDNPHADIKGGNENGCESVLVRTGVWSGVRREGKETTYLENDEENPGKYVVDDMQSAFKLIIEKENLE